MILLEGVTSWPVLNRPRRIEIETPRGRRDAELEVFKIILAGIRVGHAL